MTKLPTMLYKSPGIHKKPGGGTYSYISVQTQEEFDDKLAAGWFSTSSDAITAAGDKANGPERKKPKWMLKPAKKQKASKPLGLREKAQEAPAVVSVQEQPAITSDDAAPTREELETKATELGIRFDGRTKDKKLGQLIEDKLSEINTGE